MSLQEESAVRCCCSGNARHVDTEQAQQFVAMPAAIVAAPVDKKNRIP